MKWAPELILFGSSVADPGFPFGWGGGKRQAVAGGADLRHGHFSAKIYAKTKELDPVGGGAPVAPPRSANDDDPKQRNII